MTEGFSRYDTADYLKTDEDIIFYLDACLEEDPGDASLLQAALSNIARAKGMSQLARQAGITDQSLSSALSTRDALEVGTLMKIIQALGIRLQVTSI